MIIDAKIGGVSVDSILCGGKTIYSTGAMTPKEEYIALHTPNVGTNLFKDSKFADVGIAGSGKTWIVSGNTTPTIANGSVTISVAGTEFYISQLVSSLTPTGTYTISFKGTFTGVTGPAGASGFAISVGASNHDPYSAIFTGTFEEVKSISFTINAGEYASLVLFQAIYNTGGTIKIENMMLNSGSTPLPYAFNTLQELEDWADILYP